MPSHSTALVLDASVAVPLASKEIGRDTIAKAALELTLSAVARLFAPSAIVTETLFALCRKQQNGKMTATEHHQAVADFVLLMQSVLLPPSGDAALIGRIHTLQAGYG